MSGISGMHQPRFADDLQYTQAKKNLQMDWWSSLKKHKKSA